MTRSAAIWDGGVLPPLKTLHLEMRLYEADDLDRVAMLYADADVTAFTKLGQRDRAQTKIILDEYLRSWRDLGFGMRALFRTQDDCYVGECGLFALPSGQPALRYALLKPFWGQGLAKEAVVASVDDAFTRVGAHRIISIVQKRNIASRRLMEKLGWPEATTEVDGKVELQIYEKTRAQWMAHDEVPYSGKTDFGRVESSRRPPARRKPLDRSASRAPIRCGW